MSEPVEAQWHPSIQKCANGPGTLCVVIAREDMRSCGLEGVRVSIEGPSPGAGVSDNLGVADFQGRTPGLYRIEASPEASRYGKWVMLEYAKTVVVAAGEVSLAEIFMAPTGSLVLEVRRADGPLFQLPVSVDLSGPSGKLSVEVRGTRSYPDIRAGCYVAMGRLGQRQEEWLIGPPAQALVPADGTAKMTIVVRPLTWVAIELVDTDDRPVADEEFLVVSPDGREFRGRTDRGGFACIDRIPSGQCRISFPRRGADSWGVA